MISCLDDYSCPTGGYHEHGQMQKVLAKASGIAEQHHFSKYAQVNPGPTFSLL